MNNDNNLNPLRLVGPEWPDLAPSTDAPAPDIITRALPRARPDMPWDEGEQGYLPVVGAEGPLLRLYGDDLPPLSWGRQEYEREILDTDRRIADMAGHSRPHVTAMRKIDLPRWRTLRGQLAVYEAAKAEQEARPQPGFLAKAGDLAVRVGILILTLGWGWLLCVLLYVAMGGAK